MKAATKRKNVTVTHLQAVDKPEEKSDIVPVSLYSCDFRRIELIKPQSVDWVITDPPYAKEYLPLYSDLSRRAELWLKPGGSLLVMSGQSYLPEVVR
jgi:16S rRNA G966 N2-methylase RsmD